MVGSTTTVELLLLQNPINPSTVALSNVTGKLICVNEFLPETADWITSSNK
jgi:hypothetical protein